MPIKEGSVLRLADQEFIVKRICQRFSDLDAYQQDQLRTLSDIELNDNINLAHSCLHKQPSRLNPQKTPLKLQKTPLKENRSPVLKGSKLIMEKTLPKVESMSSVGDQEESCRVCFGRDGGENNPLLSLCRCSGSVKSIHYQCLRKWVSTRSKHISRGSYEYYEYNLSCDLCKQQIDRVISHQGRRYAVYS